MFDQTQQPGFGNPMQQPMGMGMGGQYNYAGYQQPVPKIMNVLTADEIKELQQQRSQFTLGLTEREVKQAACNHRSPDGMTDSLTYDQDTGIARCTICGYEFRPQDPDSSYETIKDACDRVVDILQTSKMMYVDLPNTAAREYYQIIPLIEKIPQLFEFAAKNFAKHEFNSWNYNNSNMGGVAMLQNLNNMFGAPVQPMMQPQPMMQQPMGMAPGYPQAAYQQPIAGANVFGYQGASQQYAPMNSGFAYQPAQGQVNPAAPTVAAPAAPAEATAAPANAEKAETTVTETVTV